MSLEYAKFTILWVSFSFSKKSCSRYSMKWMGTWYVSGDNTSLNLNVNREAVKVTFIHTKKKDKNGFTILLSTSSLERLKCKATKSNKQQYLMCVFVYIEWVSSSISRWTNSMLIAASDMMFVMMMDNLQMICLSKQQYVVDFVFRFFLFLASQRDMQCICTVVFSFSLCEMQLKAAKPDDAYFTLSIKLHTASSNCNSPSSNRYRFNRKPML